MMTTLAKGYMITTINLYIHQNKTRPFPLRSFFVLNLLQFIEDNYYLYNYIHILYIQLLSNHLFYYAWLQLPIYISDPPPHRQWCVFPWEKQVCEGRGH